MSLSRAVATEMRGKYAEMLVMRIEHAQGVEDPLRVRPRMSELAARFPGALREIDRLEQGEIERRIGRLDAFLETRAEAEPWMVAVAIFHRLARGALGAKKWLARRRTVDAALVAAFAKEAPHLPFHEEIQAWAPDLATIASPPRGRLMDLVFARLAGELGVSESAARSLVHG